MADVNIGSYDMTMRPSVPSQTDAADGPPFFIFFCAVAWSIIEHIYFNRRMSPLVQLQGLRFVFFFFFFFETVALRSASTVGT